MGSGEVNIRQSQSLDFKTHTPLEPSQQPYCLSLAGYLASSPEQRNNGGSTTDFSRRVT